MNGFKVRKLLSQFTISRFNCKEFPLNETKNEHSKRRR